MTNTANKKGFILYHDMCKMFDELSDEQAGQLIKYIIKYSENKSQANPSEPNGLSELSGLLSIIAIPFKNHIDRDYESWLAICEINRNNGKKGGRKKLKRTEPNPTKADNDKDNDNDNKKDNDNVNETKKEPNNNQELTKAEPYNTNTNRDINTNYYYNGRTIKLTKEDYDRWQNNYPNINLAKELPSLDDFYTEAKERKWFIRCSQALANKNKKAPIVKIQKGSL